MSRLACTVSLVGSNESVSHGSLVDVVVVVIGGRGTKVDMVSK